MICVRFWDFGQPETFVSRKKFFVSQKKFFVSQNEDHLRGTLYPEKSILYPKKVAPIERWLALAAGGSVLSSESRGEHPVVARRRPHGDRREVR